MTNNILKTAIKEAYKSNHRQRHGCVIFKGSKIISVGFNEIRYCSRLDEKYKKWINSLHAEQKTILFSDCSLKRCSLLVVRINRKGNLRNSKPCRVCMGLIKDVGISKVYYSNDFEGVERLEI